MEACKVKFAVHPHGIANTIYDDGTLLRLGKMDCTRALGLYLFSDESKKYINQVWFDVLYSGFV